MSAPKINGQAPVNTTNTETRLPQKTKGKDTKGRNVTNMSKLYSDVVNSSLVHTFVSAAGWVATKIFARFAKTKAKESISDNNFDNQGKVIRAGVSALINVAIDKVRKLFLPIADPFSAKETNDIISGVTEYNEFATEQKEKRKVAKKAEETKKAEVETENIEEGESVAAPSSSITLEQVQHIASQTATNVMRQYHTWAQQQTGNGANPS